MRGGVGVHCGGAGTLAVPQIQIGVRRGLVAVCAVACRQAALQADGVAVKALQEGVVLVGPTGADFVRKSEWHKRILAHVAIRLSTVHESQREGQHV